MSNTNTRKTTPKTSNTSMITKTDSKESSNARPDALKQPKGSSFVTDLQVGEGRVMYILGRVIIKLQIAICLPRLLRHNACILYSHLEPTKVKFIQNVCEKYTDNLNAPVKEELLATISTDTAKRITEENLLTEVFKRTSLYRPGIGYIGDPELAQALEMIWKTDGLRKMIMASFDQISKNYTTNLVDCVRALKQEVELRFSKTVAEEKSHENYIRSIWFKTPGLEEELTVMKSVVENQKTELEETLKRKKSLISKLLLEIEELKKNVKDTMKQETYQSEKRMKITNQLSNEIQVDLSTKAKQITQQYEDLVVKHRVIEKRFRARRTRIEKQLEGWLTKFDSEVGEKQDEYDRLDDLCNDLIAKMEAIQTSMNEQESEYQLLLAQWEEEEMARWEEIAYIFLLNRSARRIQNCWRAYWQRKLERKRARKGKNKEQGQGKKGSKKAKGKAEKPAEPIFMPDPMADLGKKFGGGVFDDLKGDLT